MLSKLYSQRETCFATAISSFRNISQHFSVVELLYGISRSQNFANLTRKPEPAHASVQPAACDGTVENPGPSQLPLKQNDSCLVDNFNLDSTRQAGQVTSKERNTGEHR